MCIRKKKTERVIRLTQEETLTVAEAIDKEENYVGGYQVGRFNTMMVLIDMYPEVENWTGVLINRHNPVHYLIKEGTDETLGH